MTVVIGNGESRKSFDLNNIKSKTYGCNALYRDFTPDYLISIDNKMIHEIVESGYIKHNNCYFEDFDVMPAEVVEFMRLNFENNYEIIENQKTSQCFVRGQNKIKDKNKYEFIEKDILYLTWIPEEHKIQTLPVGMPLMDSGPIATWIACLNEIDDIYLIGIDLFTNQGKINNIYKDTECYSSSESPGVNVKESVGFFDKVFTTFTDRNFYWIHKDFTNLDIVKKYNNVHHLTYDELNKEL